EKLNLQFVIDAFASKDSIQKETNIDLKIHSVLLRRGNLRYDVESERTTPGRFNPKHIDIDNISANISLRAFSNDSINAHIKRLSFDEASGLSLDKLTCGIVGNREEAYLDHFEVRLPQSLIQIDRARVDLRKVEGLTTLLNDAPVELLIAPSRICLQELTPFIPSFAQIDNTVEIAAEASGYVNNIHLKELSIRQDNSFLFHGMMELKGITNPEETYLFGRVNDLFITTEGMEDLLNKTTSLSPELQERLLNLGTLRFKGEVSGFFDNMVAYGQFTSAIGSIETDMIIGNHKETDVELYLRGNLSTSGLAIAELLPDNNDFGSLRFDLSVDLSKRKGEAPAGRVEGEIKEFDFRHYNYENILLSGNFKHNGFDGTIHIDDLNGELLAEGMFEHSGQQSVFNFTAQLNHFRPDRLNLTDFYDAPEISASLSVDFTGNTIDNLEGNIRLEKASIQTAPGDFALDLLEVSASGHAEDRKLAVRSDFMNGEITGAYSFKTIFPSFVKTFDEYLPALVKKRMNRETLQENNFSLLFTFENTERMSSVLKLPVTIQEEAQLTGYYNNRYNKFRIEGKFPRFAVGKTLFESGYLFCENPIDKVDLQLSAININKKGLQNSIRLVAEAQNNQLSTALHWKNNKANQYGAELTASTLFVEEIDERNTPSLRTEVSIEESSLVVNDSIWTIQPAAITIREGRIGIDNFIIDRDDQFLHLDGYISQNPNDTLLLALQKIELAYVFDIVGIEALQFGGNATGTFNINDLYNSRMLNTDLEVKDFSFNQTRLGDLNLFSEWDDEQRGILMLGSIYKNDSTFTDVNGYIYPIKPQEGLSLHFDANEIDVAFLRPYLKDVAKNLEGTAFGHAHLYGPFKKLNVTGEVFAKDVRFGIDFLNTDYSFSDSVLLTPGSIQLRNATVHDKWGNSARASLTFNHTHFKDYDFSCNIQANNFLMYDQIERNNPLMYGTAFGTGSAIISGNKKLINFDINVRSEANTAASLNFMTNSASGEYSFITFADKSAINSDRSATDEVAVKQPPTSDEGMEMRMNMLIELTPDAEIELIMDPNAGDRIKGNASGSLQIEYGNKSDLRMYGIVDILQGNYNFSMQQLIHRDFRIREGSTISFQGDPFNANINVNATYNLTANLSDLDQGLLEVSNRANVPVNCVLMLDGMLRNPTISFDIELPSSNEEVERQVRSFIDADITRQVVYLLVLSKFYTPDYTSNMYRSNELNAVASSAISSQLSGILNSITDKVQIGTNIRAAQDGFTEETEVEMLLSSQLLDNRLIFNGNFGYRNSILQQRNVFVGEFDLEYKLTRSGEIRLKAYNHANDMYQYLKQSLTTQGVGIMYKKEFTRFSEIFRRRKTETSTEEKEEEELPAVN
ncbi:translocation/assembly module TamB, partial [Parabacteroides sp. OttesenSCG-928-N08]|nr:translocation/assembly module TamB [Parabacteroides sp. OttesenSCG-928-N08]